MIDELDLEKAMNYLARTDAECAALKADVARSEYLAKVAEALAFRLAEGNNEERKAWARTAEQVQEAWDKHFSAIRVYEEMRARRERAALTVEVWRTTSANMRRAA